jgi:site-specific DNA-methyltransferase (adenine-specific)
MIKEKYFEINKIYHNDIFKVMDLHPDNSFDMIYSDPDYNVGIKYNEKSYTKNFDEYIDWYIRLAKESVRLLKENGNIFFINYPKQNSYLRVKYLDKACYDVHEYVWIYNTNVGHSPKKFTTAHRTILHCRKSKDNKWFKDAVAEPYLNPTDKRILNNLANGSKGRMPYSWLYYNLVKNVSKDKTIHACQIPSGLVETLIKASTKENDLVLIHFGGSGNEIILTKQLNRNFVSAELDEKYYKMIKTRLNLNGRILPEYKLVLPQTKKSDYNTLTLFDKGKTKYNAKTK